MSKQGRTSLGQWLSKASQRLRLNTRIHSQDELSRNEEPAARELNGRQAALGVEAPGKPARKKFFSPGPFPFIRKLSRAVWREIWEDDCVDLAAQTSFYIILAIFPFFIILAALSSYLPITGIWHEVVLGITQYFPRSSQDLVIQTILDLTRERGKFLSFGAAASALAASTGIMSLMDALNTAYEVRETRSYFKRRALALGMLFVLCLFFLLGFGLLTVGEELGNWINARFQLGPYFGVLWRLASWAVSIAMLVLGMAFVDRVLPDARRPWRWVTVGAIFVVAASIPASLGLRFYVRHFTLYPTAYGTFGAFFVLMLWVYMESLIILVGAELNSELEKMRSRQVPAPRGECR